MVNKDRYIRELLFLSDLLGGPSKVFYKSTRCLPKERLTVTYCRYSDESINYCRCATAQQPIGKSQGARNSKPLLSSESAGSCFRLPGDGQFWSLLSLLTRLGLSWPVADPGWL